MTERKAVLLAKRYYRILLLAFCDAKGALRAACATFLVAHATTVILYIGSLAVLIFEN